MSVVITWPERVAEKLVTPPPAIPWGSLKVTLTVNGPLYVAGSAVRVNEPRLSTFGVPGMLPIPRKPPAVVPEKVELV
jgi:hypothetical protein